MKRDEIDSILSKMQKPASQTARLDSVRNSIPVNKKKITPEDLEDDEDDDDYIPVGVGGLLAASEKLLAVNRGIDKPDERDSLIFKRFMTTDRLLAERIDMDADRTRMKIMPAIAKQRSLKSMPPFVFDHYMEGFLLGNPLSTPLEEINPLHLVEQSRRVTQMGPGGIGSDNAVTEDMQNIHPSQFGFISTLEGPECMDGESEVYTKRGWVKWQDIKDSDYFACKVDGRFEYNLAERVVRQHYNGEMILGEHSTIRMCVTPNHRVYNTRSDGGKIRVDLAKDVLGKTIKIPITHAPFESLNPVQYFQLPTIPVTNGSQRVYDKFDIGDWAEFLGWWFAEGSLTKKLVRIHQCPTTNPTKYKRIHNLLTKMGLVGDTIDPKAKAFAIGSKQILNFFKTWSNGCYDKWIPEECFSYPSHARIRMLEALLLGDGRWNEKRMAYCTVCYRLACDVERLAIELGYPSFIRIEQDKRENVNTTNYVVSISRSTHRQLQSSTFRHSNGISYGNYWSTIPYKGLVYCATVSGGQLLVRGKPGTTGFWTGNSEKAGIDTRMAWGTRIGSNGKLYQLFKDRISGKMKWMSPSDLDGKVLGLPQ